MGTVDEGKDFATSICNGPGRRDIRARSLTFVVWVAEKRIVWRSGGEVSF